MNKKLICHVCGKEKKPYTVFLKNNAFSLIRYNQAREKGEICQRCDQYFAMTGEFKDATEQEFQMAKNSVTFSQLVFKWWCNDKPLMITGDELKDLNENKRNWQGTIVVSKFFAKFMQKQNLFDNSEISEKAVYFANIFKLWWISDNHQLNHTRDFYGTEYLKDWYLKQISK